MFTWHTSDASKSIFTHITVKGDTITVYPKTTMYGKHTTPYMGMRELYFLNVPLECIINGKLVEIQYSHLSEKSLAHARRNLHAPNETRAIHTHYTKPNDEPITIEEFHCFIERIANHQIDKAQREALRQEQQSGMTYFADWLISWAIGNDPSYFNLKDLFILPEDIQPLLQAYQTYVISSSLQQESIQILCHYAEKQGMKLSKVMSNYDATASNLQECNSPSPQVKDAISAHNVLFDSINQTKEDLNTIQTQLESLKNINSISTETLETINSKLLEIGKNVDSIEQQTKKQLDQSKSIYSCRGLTLWHTSSASLANDPLYLPTNTCSPIGIIGNG